MTKSPIAAAMSIEGRRMRILLCRRLSNRRLVEAVAVKIIIIQIREDNDKYFFVLL